MTLYKLIQAGETIPENAVFFDSYAEPVKTAYHGTKFSPRIFSAHFIPVEVPDEKPAPAPQTEEIPLGPEDVPPGSVIRCREWSAWGGYATPSVFHGGISWANGTTAYFVPWDDLARKCPSEWEISRDGGKTWQPCRKPAKGAEPVWHNPDRVPMDKIPEGWRLMVPAEVDGRHKGKCMGWNEGINSWEDRCRGTLGNWTYIVPADTPLPTEA